MPNSRFIIRNITSEDIPSILEIGLQAFDWPSERMWWGEDAVRWFVENAWFPSFVAECDGRIIGFILCSVTEKKGDVSWIAVDARWRQQGVGSRLMHYALAALRVAGVETVSSFVREDGATDRLFKRFGFRNLGLRKLDMVLDFSESTRIRGEKSRKEG